MPLSDLADQLDHIFYPKTTAIVGASSREGSFGRLFLEGFLHMGYKEIFPIHPRENELLGLKAYPSVKEVPGKIDLAILLTPPEQAPKIVQECADKHIRGILVFTAGFREKGEAGRRAELELAEIARKGGSRLIGPNSNGFYSPASHLLTLPGSLTAGGLSTERGALSAFSHSGSFNDYLSQVLVGKNIRFNKVVSCGNEADLTAVDFLEYFGNDSGTTVIAGYLEGIKDGRRFFELAKNISKRKPIVIWKGGSTETGARAALAHTGSLAGSKQVWNAMFKQTGIVQVGSFEEMVDTLLAFSWMPQPKGKKVAIVSGMGGTNVGTADNCTNMGLEIAKFSEATLRTLAQILPALGTAAANPVDVGVGMLLAPQIYGQVLKLLANDENVDMLIAITAPEASLSVQSIASVKADIGKPLAVALFDIKGLVEAQAKYLLDRHIPTYLDATRAALALSRMAEYARYRARD